jgi:hypothetical protein
MRPELSASFFATAAFAFVAFRYVYPALRALHVRFAAAIFAICIAFVLIPLPSLMVLSLIVPFPLIIFSNRAFFMHFLS